MIYKLIFEKSGFTDLEIRQKLGINKSQFNQFMETENFNPNRIVKYCKLLNVSGADAAEIIRQEILNNFKR